MPLNIDLQQILLHLFNFVVLFAILYFLLYKPVKSFMDKRTASYEEIRKMRHDIDNHVYTMRAMMDAGRTEEAAVYVRELASQDPAKKTFASCANMVAASYLTKKMEDYKRLGIELDADIHLPLETGITNPDLICVFGNILDNAQEACEGLENPKVELKAQYQKQSGPRGRKGAIRPEDANPRPGARHRAYDPGGPGEPIRRAVGDRGHRKRVQD